MEVTFVYPHLQNRSYPPFPCKLFRGYTTTAQPNWFRRWLGKFLQSLKKLCWWQRNIDAFDRNLPVVFFTIFPKDLSESPNNFPSAKSTKSWVAERVSWNSGRDCAAITEVDSGKNHDICLDSEVQTVFVNSELDESEELGCVGGKGNQEEESQGVKGTVPQPETEILPEDLLDQGIGLESHAAKDMKLAWAVKGIAGLSCDRQEGKLKQVFGQIVVDKYGGGAAVPTGVNTDDNLGVRDEDFSYET
jgi:hypothetical protein